MSTGDYVSIGTPKTIYVLMKSRSEFDQIALEERDHRKLAGGNAVLTKAIDKDGVTVIFQYWLEVPA